MKAARAYKFKKGWMEEDELARDNERRYGNQGGEAHAQCATACLFHDFGERRMRCSV